MTRANGATNGFVEDFDFIVETKQTNITRSSVLILCFYVLLIGLFADAGTFAQNPVIQIGIIEYYGLRTVPQETVSQVLDIAVEDTLADASAGITGTDQNRAIVERLEGIPGVAQVRVKLVCCTEAKTWMLYVGIAEEEAPQLEYRTPPDLAVSLPQEITETRRAWNEERQRRKGNPGGDVSQGHYLSGHPEVRAIEERLTGLVEEHQKSLRQVLRYAADAQQRQTAAWVIAYASDKRTAVEDLLYAASDPEYWIRNNAILKLVDIAKFAQEKPELGIQIPPGIFISMLNSFDWTDRQKSLLLLEILTRDRDAAVLEQLRQEAFPALVEMARWQFMYHASPAYTLLCRVDGLSDEEIAETLRRGEKEAVIARIVESGQTR